MVIGETFEQLYQLYCPELSKNQPSSKSDES